jgi:uncharacterized repeat protein (TIGR01451 family)
VRVLRPVAAVTAVVIVGWLGSTAPALAAPPATYVSGNLGSSIPDNASLDSALDVAATGEIVDVKVAVNVGHARDDQLNFDLVAPDGTVVRLAHDFGDSGRNYGSGSDCSGGFTEFADGASTPIAAASPPFVGSFRPETPLAALVGKASNGTWKLAVADDTPGVVGALWCWKLTITTAQSDLGLSVVDSPDPVEVGGMLLYTNVVTNNGPDASQSTTLTAALPGPVAFVLAQTTQGECVGVTDIVCPLGTLAAGASATVTIAVQPRTPGEVSYSANVVGTPDPTGLTGNNAASATTTVAVAAPAARGCTITGTRGDDVLVGTDGDDVICGLGGDDSISAGDGDDVVYGDAGDDTIFGGDGDDRLEGRAGDDRVDGEAGADFVFGGAGDDRVIGGDDGDWLKGGAGADVLNAGPGDDVLLGRGDGTRDVLKGGPGKDQGLLDAGLDARLSVERLLSRPPPVPVAT